MTFLPIVARELRIVSRRKSTFRFRSLSALSALVLAAFYLTMFGGFSGGRQVGLVLFTVLSWILFVLCLIAGVLLGADSISEERREGTLGLLFLTDLRGYDIVLGKFIGISLNAFYSLFAAIPVLALPLMIGGVTGAEYWRTMLALVNALFFGFAVAIFISARCTESSRALAGTCAFLFISAVLFPCLNVTLPTPSGLVSFFTFVSPLVPMGLATAGQYIRTANRYWTSVGISFLFSCSLVIWTCFRISQTVTAQTHTRFPFFGPNSALGRTMRSLSRRDSRLLTPNPIVWLLDTPLSRRALLSIALVFVGVLVVLGAVGEGEAAVGGGAVFLYIVILVGKALVAVQACRLFGESRRDGTFELLRSTPLSPRQMVQGQISNLGRMFGPPALIAFFGYIAMFSVFAPKDIFGTILYVAYFGLKAITGFYAAAWFGIWMSLTARTPTRAIASVVGFTVVAPMVVLCVPDVISDAILIGVANSKVKGLMPSDFDRPAVATIESSPPIAYRF